MSRCDRRGNSKYYKERTKWYKISKLKTTTEHKQSYILIDPIIQGESEYET
jgi:hypothetical protein